MGFSSARAAGLPRIPLAAPRAEVDVPAPGTPVETAAPAVSPSAFAPATSAAAATGAAPAPITGPDGRVYTPGVDPATGHPQYTHHSTNTGTDGITTKLDIVIDIAPDGSFTRSTHQHLTDTAGNVRDQTELASYDPAGAQLTDDTHSEVHIDGKIQHDHTVSTYTAGTETHRQSDIDQTEHTAAAGGETIDSTVTLKAVYDAAGAPITDTTVPHLTRTDSAVYHQPGQGINKDTDRVLTTEFASSGTPVALVPDGPMKLTVHFNGHGNQYIERVLSVPLDAAGAPNFAAATEVSSADHQSTTVKALTQARVWGGFASSLLGIAGARLIGVAGGGAGKVLLGAGLAAGGASLLGETHALVTKRNDGSIERELMAVYDNATMIAYYAYLRGQGALSLARGSSTGAGAASAAGLDSTLGTRQLNATMGFGVNAALHSAMLSNDLTGDSGLGHPSKLGGSLTNLKLPTAPQSSFASDPLLQDLQQALPAH